MDEQKTQQQGGRNMCGCCGVNNSCGCGWHHGHRIFRVVLVLIALFIAFWIGVKMGEVREAISEAGYGFGGYGEHHMMMYGGNYYDEGQAVTQPQPAQVGATGGTSTPAK